MKDKGRSKIRNRKPSDHDTDMWKKRGLGRESLRPLCRSDKISTNLTPLRQRLFIRGFLMDRNGHPLVPTQ